MKNLGIHYSEGVGVGPGEDGNWTQFGAYSDEFRIGLYLPTLDVPAIASALLGAAQEASRKLPAAEVVAFMAKSIEGQFSRPLDAVGFRYVPSEGLLLVNLGFGVLALKPLNAAIQELADLGRDISRPGGGLSKGDKGHSGPKH